MKLRAVAIAVIGLVATGGVALLATGQEAPAKPRKVTKTDAEWRKLLTREQYMVTRQAATEPAGSGKLLNNHAKGIYECVGCGSPLFSSQAKFESGTGWPSFFIPYTPGSVDTSTDYKLGYARTEVVCNACGGHLGHVFDDGPPPTGLRYCMNSAALKFAKDAPAASHKATTKEKSQPKKDAPAAAEKKDTPAAAEKKDSDPTASPK